MHDASTADLLCRCREAQASGSDFPTIWRSFLKTHPLVIGLPSHEIRDGAPLMVIQLWTGQKLVSSTSGFELI